MPLLSSAHLHMRTDAVLLAVAVVCCALASAPAGAAEWTGGGLPSAIAKPRPSADVPADLPADLHGSGDAVLGWPVIAAPVVALPPPPDALSAPSTAYRPFAPRAAVRASRTFAPPAMEGAPVDLLTPRPADSRW